MLLWALWMRCHCMLFSFFCSLFLIFVSFRLFRVICFHLSEETSRKFPKHKYTAVAGFIFLRFFCAAIMSPVTYKLIDGMSSVLVTVLVSSLSFLCSAFFSFFSLYFTSCTLRLSLVSCSSRTEQRSTASLHPDKQAVAKCGNWSGVRHKGMNNNPLESHVQSLSLFVTVLALSLSLSVSLGLLICVCFHFDRRCT